MLHLPRPAGLNDLQAAKAARALTRSFGEPVTFAPRPQLERPPGLSSCYWATRAETKAMTPQPAPGAHRQPWEPRAA